jgi:hypothetical protein
MLIAQMGRNEYKGKRVTVTMPTEVFDALEKLAKRETRSNSQAALFLIQEGLRERKLISDPDSDSEK